MSEEVPEPAHRLHRKPESDAALVLRAVAWAALWFVLVDRGGLLINGRHAWAPGVVLAALAVLQVVQSHRRHQR